MFKFEDLIKQEQQNEKFAEFALAIEMTKDKQKQDIAVDKVCEEFEDKQIDKKQQKLPIDDFGQLVVPKASSPFETKQTAKKVLNPHQNSLQSYLKQQQKDKVLQKALTLYKAFKKHCAQNKIDPNIFTGVK